MRLLFSLLISASVLLAAEIRIQVVNDAGKQVSSVVLTTNDAVLAALNSWRLAQQTRDANSNLVPAYPTVESLWRSHIRNFVISAIGDSLDAIKTEQAKIDAANAKIKELKEGAIAP
jgi:hypothetical protein